MIHAGDDMKDGLVDKMLSIPDAQKAENDGWAIRDALEYAKDGMKGGLVDKMLSIPDAQKAKTYGSAIRDALEHAGKDMQIQQQIIRNILEDS